MLKTNIMYVIKIGYETEGCSYQMLHKRAVCGCSLISRRWQHVRFFFWCLPFSSLTSSSFSFYVAAIVCGDDTVLLTQTPSRMSQRQVKERDKEREREREKEKEKEKEVGLQTPNREQLASPSTLSPGVSYSHGKICIPFPKHCGLLLSLVCTLLLFESWVHSEREETRERERVMACSWNEIMSIIVIIDQRVRSWLTVSPLLYVMSS